MNEKEYWKKAWSEEQALRIINEHRYEKTIKGLEDIIGRLMKILPMHEL